MKSATILDFFKPYSLWPISRKKFHRSEEPFFKFWNTKYMYKNAFSKIFFEFFFLIQNCMTPINFQNRVQNHYILMNRNMSINTDMDWDTDKVRLQSMSVFSLITICMYGYYKKYNTVHRKKQFIIFSRLMSLWRILLPNLTSALWSFWQTFFLWNMRHI